MIALVDYGMGNLGSVDKALSFVGADPLVTADPADVTRADAIVLPGVGACGDCMANLRSGGLLEPVKEALAAGKPYLGICLGLQILFEESEEGGGVRCLGVISGKVQRFRHQLKIPQIGWNQLNLKQNAPHLAEVPDGAWVYFVHSYHVVPDDEAVIATTTDYGYEFVSAVCRDNVFATQFHPEKSQEVGLQILRNFCRLIRL